MRTVAFALALFVVVVCAQPCSVQGTWKNDFDLASLGTAVGATGFFNSTISFDGSNFKSSTIRVTCTVTVSGTFTYTQATGDLTFSAGMPNYKGNTTGPDCGLLQAAATFLGAQPDSNIVFASDCLSYNESLVVASLGGVTVYREWIASAASLVLAPVLLVLLFAHLFAL